MTRNDAPGARPRRTDGLSLVFGLIFLGVAGTWALQHFLDQSQPGILLQHLLIFLEGPLRLSLLLVTAAHNVLRLGSVI